MSTSLTPPHFRPSTALVASAVIAPFAVWLGLLGPAWAYVPAQGSSTPAAEMNYADLSSVNSASAAALQSWYFTWGAWLLAALTLVVAILAIRVGGRTVGIVATVLGVAGLVITVFAMKGPLSWGTLIGGFENTRLGAALVFIGFLSLIAAGVQLLRPAPESRSATIPNTSQTPATA